MAGSSPGRRRKLVFALVLGAAVYGGFQCLPWLLVLPDLHQRGGWLPRTALSFLEGSRPERCRKWLTYGEGLSWSYLQQARRGLGLILVSTDPEALGEEWIWDRLRDGSLGTRACALLLASLWDRAGVLEERLEVLLRGSSLERTVALYQWPVATGDGLVRTLTCPVDLFEDDRAGTQLRILLSIEDIDARASDCAAILEADGAPIVSRARSMKEFATQYLASMNRGEFRDLLSTITFVDAGVETRPWGPETSSFDRVIGSTCDAIWRRQGDYSIDGFDREALAKVGLPDDSRTAILLGVRIAKSVIDASPDDFEGWRVSSLLHFHVFR